MEEGFRLIDEEQATIKYQQCCNYAYKTYESHPPIVEFLKPLQHWQRFAWIRWHISEIRTNPKPKFLERGIVKHQFSPERTFHQRFQCFVSLSPFTIQRLEEGRGTSRPRWTRALGNELKP